MTTSDYLESLQDNLDTIVDTLELDEGSNFSTIASMVESGEISKGGGGPTDIYKVATIQERDALHPNEGDICLVYGTDERSITQDDSNIEEIWFPETVVFEDAISDWHSMELRPDDTGSPSIYIDLSSDHVTINIEDTSPIYINYFSDDGLTYTMEETTTSATLSSPVNIVQWDNNCAKFIITRSKRLDGLFQYNNSSWENLDIGMDTSAADVLLDKKVLTNNGPIIGVTNINDYLKKSLIISDTAPSDTSLIWIKPSSTYSDLIDKNIVTKTIHIIDESKMTPRNEMINVIKSNSQLNIEGNTPRLVQVSGNVFGNVKNSSSNGEVDRVDIKTGTYTSVASPFGACTIGCLYHFKAPDTLIGVSGRNPYSGSTQNTYVYLFSLTSPYSTTWVFNNQVKFNGSASGLKYSSLDGKIYMSGYVSGTGNTYLKFEPSNSVNPVSIETITQQEFDAIPYYDTQYSLGNDYYVSGMIGGSGAYTISRITKVANNTITTINPIISNGKGGYNTIDNSDDLLQTIFCKCGNGFLSFKNNTICYIEFGYNSTEDTIEITKVNYLYRYQSASFVNKSTFNSIGYYDDQTGTLYIYSTCSYSYIQYSLVTKIENFDITPCTSFNYNDLTVVLNNDNTYINTGIIQNTCLNIKDIILPYKTPTAIRAEAVNTGMLPDSTNAVEAVYSYDNDAANWVAFIDHSAQNN